MKISNDTKYKALIGIVLAIIIQYLIVAKHYAYHYMIPSLCLSVFGIYLITEISFRAFQKFQITNILKNSLYLLIIILIIVNSYNYVIADNLIRKQEIVKRMETLNFINSNIRGKVVLLVPWFYGSAFVERGLVEGLFYTGKYKATYSKLLQKYYPHTYFFLPWHERYYDWQLIWDNGLDLEKFIKNNKEIYIYFGIDDENLIKEIFNDLISLCPLNRKEPIKVYYNNITNESIFKFK